jgi:hypothetical protein
MERLQLRITRLLVLGCAPLLANTFPVTCSGTIDSALSTAISSASDGDTISLSSGTCTLSAKATWSNKNIYLIGAGKDVTNINAAAGV